MVVLAVAPASLLAPAGLMGGFAAARSTGRRAIGGAVFAAAGAVCVREWSHISGTTAAGLGGLYVAAMGGSHPLAKKLGPWPAVLVVAAVTGLSSELLTRRAAAG